MIEERNTELTLKEILEEAVDRFGKGSQEGAKDAIKSCQEEFGCVSQDHQSQIAEAFELKENIIKAIIKFMPSIKESKVKYEIVCCTGPRCANNGSMEVIKTVQKMLGIRFDQTTSDGNICLRSQNCFRQCKFGPNIMINGKLYHNIDKIKVEKIIKEII